MSLTESEVRLAYTTLLRAPSERTLQSRVGASDLANPCDRCVGRAFINGPEPLRYMDPWLAASSATGSMER